MAMRMLEAGGLLLVIDGIRTADDDNPNGYYELEAVKALDKGGDTAWLAGARGKAVKIVSHLVTWLPETYDYQVLFMERSLDEVMASQDKMLVNRDRVADAGDDARIRSGYERHLEQTKRFLAGRACFSTLYLAVSRRGRATAASGEAYRDVPGASVERGCDGGGGGSQLYRNRKG